MILANRSTLQQRSVRPGGTAFCSCPGKKGRRLWWLLALFVGVVGCSQPPSVEKVPIPVLKDQGAIHRTGSGETLLWISRDRGYSVIELESLIPRWKGVTIAPGTEILLPVGKPMIRRVQKKSGGR